MSTTRSRFWRALAIVAAVGLGCWIAKALSPLVLAAPRLRRLGWRCRHMHNHPQGACRTLMISLKHLPLMWRPVVADRRRGLSTVLQRSRPRARRELDGAKLFPTARVSIRCADLLGGEHLAYGDGSGSAQRWTTESWASRPSQPWPGNPARRVLNGDERWLYWLPRLLGVSAHLFAAINLSLAAWRVPIAAWGEPGELRWLAWSAPVTIILATAFVWAEDVKRSSRILAIASANKIKLAQRVSWISIVGEIGAARRSRHLAAPSQQRTESFRPRYDSHQHLLRGVSRGDQLAQESRAATRTECDPRRTRGQRSTTTQATGRLHDWPVPCCLAARFLVWISPIGVWSHSRLDGYRLLRIRCDSGVRQFLRIRGQPDLP